MLYEYVFRHHGPHYGKRCAIVARSRLSIDQWGSIIHHTGGEAVAIQFEDGTKIEARREQIICAGSVVARQVVAKAARGATTMRDHRRREGRLSKETTT